LNSQPNHSGFTDAADAVVTYSRVASRPAKGGRRAREAAPAMRAEPVLDAAEIRLVEPQSDEVRLVEPRVDGDVDFTPHADLRADRRDPGADPLGEERGGGTGRYVIAGAALAILAGAGVIAATVGVMLTPTSEIASTATPSVTPSTPPAKVALLPPPSSEPADDVRRIPLSAGDAASIEKPAAPAAAPVPRPRPEGQAASVEAKPPVEGKPAVAAPVAPKPSTAKNDTADPVTASISAAVPVLPPPAVAAAPSKAPDASDALIENIEKTLAKVDSEPGAAAVARAEGRAIPVLPPPGEPQVATEDGPAVDMDYPPADNAYPAPAEDDVVYPPAADAGGQFYDVVPPAPVTDNGYPVAPYPPGPVPPEPVPEIYPPDQGLYEVVPVERKPGIFRRTITKTTEAMARVFSRDR
jgi:hypothetical protein